MGRGLGIGSFGEKGKSWLHFFLSLWLRAVGLRVPAEEDPPLSRSRQTVQRNNFCLQGRPTLVVPDVTKFLDFAATVFFFNVLIEDVVSVLDTTAPA